MRNSVGNNSRVTEGKESSNSVQDSNCTRTMCYACIIKCIYFHGWNTTFSHCMSNVSPADSPFYSNPWLKGNKNHEKRNFFRQKKGRTKRYQNCSLHSTERKYTSIGKKPHALKNNQNLKTIYKLNWRQKKVCEKIVCSRICKVPPQF